MKPLRCSPRKESESFESSRPPKELRCHDEEVAFAYTIVRVLLHGVFVAMLAIGLVASTRVELNGSWRFRIDRNEEGEAQGWDRTLPPGTEVVRVPHTWNPGKYDDYEGVAWYFRSLELSPAIRGQQVELHFAATFYESRVWLNGKLLGTEVTQ